MDARAKAVFLKQKASEYGFSFCGISTATELTDEARRLEQWLSKGSHGTMKYMENYFEMRIDPRKLVEGARSVISFLYNYFPAEEPKAPDAPVVSKYAYGRDYHEVIKAKLNDLLTELRETWGDIGGRAFVDSAPVLEKAWALRSGIGWMGKHTNVITKQQGSFFFLAELIIDVSLEPDAPYAKDYCGTCTACIDACPTDAIIAPQQLDASRCISYFTIELKDAIPQYMAGTFENRLFGCDICQDVCPWNRFSKPHKEPAFALNNALRDFTKRDWEEITEDVFNTVFKNSPLKRSKFNGIKRNLAFLKQQ